MERQTEEIKEKESLGQGEITLSNVDGTIISDLKKPSDIPIEKDAIIPSFLKELRVEELTPKALLLESPFSFIPVPWGRIFNDISIYDFDPKLPKKATPITGKADLEEEGGNLAIVLKKIIEDKEKKVF